LNKSIEQIRSEALSEIENAADIEQVKSISVRYLGRKGMVTQYLRDIATLPEQQRPEAGKNANLVKKTIEAAAEDAISKLSTAGQTR
jgi:phenylalanyl-tRNA synthetase alpha chain